MQRGSDSVRVVLFDRDKPDYFLILCEADDADNWKLPGGRLEAGEAPDAAAACELAEEVGLAGSDVDLVMAAELTNNDGVSKRFIYGGRTETRAVRPSAEVARVRWVTADKVPGGKNHGHISSAVTAARKAIN